MSILDLLGFENLTTLTGQEELVSYPDITYLPISTPSAVITFTFFLASASLVARLEASSRGTILMQGGHWLTGGGQSGRPLRCLGGANSPSSGDSASNGSTRTAR